MDLDDINIFSLKDRKILKNFFDRKRDFLDTHSLLDISNLKLFGDMFELFLKENNLEDNEIFKAFLLDIRREELSQKLESKAKTKKTLAAAVFPFAKPLVLPPFEASAQILKWYDASKIILVINSEDKREINKNIEFKIAQNKLERKLSWNDGAKIKVR